MVDSSLRLHKLRRKYLTAYGAKKILLKACSYLFLLEFAFIFLLPFITILTKSPKTMQDILNPVIVWLPAHVRLENFADAFHILNYGRTFFNSLFFSAIPTFLQIFTCALCGYALGKYRFFGNKLIYLLVLLTIFIPPQTVVISRYVMYSWFSFINTPWPLLLPELFGHGLRGGLFVLIYSQFFKTMPKSLDESARIDGAKPLRIFFSIAMPLAKPAIVLVTIFSFVWHWNDSYSSSMFMMNSAAMPAIVKFESLFDPRMASFQGGNPMFSNDAIKMACALLIVLPLIIMYMIVQRQFTESIERTGLVE